MEMDFQKALLEVGKSLSTDEVEALSFLCTDILSRKPVTLDGASNLFSLLMKEDRLSAGNPQLLVELLLTIQRPVILQNIKLSLPSPSTLISPYRKLLYRLSEQITEEELGDMKFLLKDIPRRRLEQKTTLGVFLEMEHMDLINESSLEYLETIFKSVCPVLNEEIRLFRKEIWHPESSPSTVKPSQTPKPSSRTDFQGDETPQLLSPSMNPSNSTNGEMASLDTVNTEKNNPESQENDEVLCDYPMTGKRGICLIVDNFDFSESYKNLTNTLRNREGTKFDRDALKEVFGWLGYEVDIHVDYNADQIKSLFTRIGQQDHSQYDSLVCCILSHGMEGKVYGVDGKLVEIKLLIECIDGENCPSLIEKPKMLFIQACQGCKEQYPVQPDGIEDETTRIFADAKIADLRSPVIADLLVGMSTVPDHASFRDKFCGTWYIQSLCKNLIKCVPRRVDLVSILTKVNFDVSGMTDFSRRRKQMPQPAFSLRKRVVFPVPEKRPPEIGALTKDNS
ncbi:caspase-8-like isoform X2 [Xiphophorus maculatus]|uniref:caspase-8-like isoform X2 n=1 Tax=Xiphophorus maculatus TaxID=8083 RepID=UPI000C6CB172|nr:caspase-8-like isoform X2 [Xiphophorus maculatus]